MSEAQRRAQLATVQLPTKGGQGVLVPGGFVLTAAHCIEWSLSGGMALGDYCLERIITQAGATFALQVVAVEPVSDIAVLECADGQAFYDDHFAFEAWCEETAPVPVCGADFERKVAVPVHILTPTGEWVGARATRYTFGYDEQPDACVRIMAEHGIEGGTSGGPVIDDAGNLVGVVSWMGGDEDDPGRDGQAPRPHLALPGWIWRRIQVARTALSCD